MPPQQSQTSLQACRLSATLLLCFLFLLPSLLFSLVFFSLFASFVLLPIVCILSSIFALLTAISRSPIMSLGRLVAKVCSLDDDRIVGEALEFIEFDLSEVPAVDESSAEEEEQFKEVFAKDGEESLQKGLRKIQTDQTPSASEEYSSF